MATELGRTEAKRDLTNGLVRLPAYGYPSMEFMETRSILKDVYGVQMYPLAACVVTRGLEAYADGYFEVARKFIEAKHGTNIWMDAQARIIKPSTGNQAQAPRTAPGPREYQIRAGDTFSRIAHEKGLTVKALTDANPNLDPTKLKVGQIILIPERSKR